MTMAATLWHDGAGFHWWFPLFPLAWFLVLWLFVWFVARRFWWRGGGRPWQSAAEDALGKRYADGEINEQGYRARLAVLRETRGR
jgi:putative membrane protein